MLRLVSRRAGHSRAPGKFGHHHGKAPLANALPPCQPRAVRILALTSLYPPHHAGTNDYRCQSVVENLRLRGHEVRVLTSSHGMHAPQINAQEERRLLLNGAYEHPLVTGYKELVALETHNHQALRESIGSFLPDVVQVFSLRGLSKSLIYGLRHSHVPTVYDVADTWLSDDLAHDPWLRWWNHPARNFARGALELSGQRGKLDETAPTRMAKGCDRMPDVFGDGPAAPSSVSTVRLERVYFCSHTLKEAAEQAGFQVGHAEVIYPGIATQTFVAAVRPVSAPVEKFLVISRLHKKGGVLTAVKALQIARRNNRLTTLGICGRGDSECIAEIRSLVAQAQLPVEFLTVSNQGRDLPAIYRRHDALLYTAEEPEPFSSTLLEAMAAGLPVIGTAIGGARELLRHGENALTCTPGQPEELAAGMTEIETRPDLRHQLAETAQAEVLAHYNESTVTDRIENYLETSRQVWEQQ